MTMPKPGSKGGALGKGLGALLPGASKPETTRRDARLVPIEHIHPRADQPRQTFEDDALEALVASLRQHGIIQPLVLRPRPASDGGGFELIAGERRWRAAGRAGLREVPAVVREADSIVAFELALVENVQRQDLNPIEEADAFRRLIDEAHLTQEALAERVGRDRSTIANTLRLLELPPTVRRLVAERRLSAGQARPLLALRDAPARLEALARRVVEQQMSARQVEAAVRADKGRDARAQVPPTRPSAAVADLEQRLRRSLGTKVTVKDQGGGKGTVEVHYHSLDELDRLIGIFSR